MSEARSNARDISLGDDFGPAVININGARIEVDADGPVVVEANGAQVVIEADGRFHAANDSAAQGKTAPEIGDQVEDGTIFAGISPNTHKPMYARPDDEPGVFTFNEAAEHAKNLDAHGHHDWRAPTKSELNVLFENHNKGKLKGTFNETGSNSAGWYWSSTPDGYYDGAWARRFSDGHQYGLRYGVSSLRLVR